MGQGRREEGDGEGDIKTTARSTRPNRPYITQKVETRIDFLKKLFGGLTLRMKNENVPESAGPFPPGLFHRARPRVIRWLVVGLLVLALGGFFALDLLQRLGDLAVLRHHLDAMQGWVQEHFLLAFGMALILFVLLTSLSIPLGAALALVAGALFGRWAGLLLASGAGTLGGTLAFLLSRFLLGDYVQRRFGNRLGFINQEVETDGLYVLFILRLLPVVPYTLVNLGMGLTRMPAWQFAGVSWVGMLPLMFLYSNAGQQLSTIRSITDIFSPGILISLVLMGLIPLVVHKIAQWKRKKKFSKKG